MLIKKNEPNKAVLLALLASTSSFATAKQLLRGNGGVLMRALQNQTPLYDVASIQTYDLGKVAAYTDRTAPVAPIAARPDGGAYIQWAGQDDWNSGNRCEANSKVYLTEVGNDGRVVSTSDIELGHSQPAGIVATASSFGYYIVDGDKLTFGIGEPGTNGHGQTVVMDHRDKSNCGGYKPYPNPFQSGLEFDSWYWQIPYLPTGGSLAYGNGHFGTGFSYANNFAPSREDGSDDTHSGDAFIFYDDNGANPTLPMARTDHSGDQRIVFDQGTGTFYSLSLAYDLRLRKYDSNGGLLDEDQPLTDPTDGVPYTDADGNTFHDVGFGRIYPNPPVETQYGLGYNGLLGDIHPFGDGTLAMTYGMWPQHINFSDNNQYFMTKNQVDYALLDNEGEITVRRVIYQADSRSGQDEYTEYEPFERVRWVKSAKIGSGSDANVMIFFQTETHSGNNNNGNKLYEQASVRMVQVDKQGLIQQGPVIVPDSAKFNKGDRVAVLSDDTLAWTHTGDGTLELSLFAAPEQSNHFPTAPSAPVAQVHSNINSDGFTAAWTAVDGATSYRIDVSTDNFQTFVVQDLAVVGTSYYVSGLQPNTSYQYRVRSFNSAGAGDNSNSVDIQTPAPPVVPTACSPQGDGGGWVSIKKTEFTDNQGNVLLENTEDDPSVAYEDFTGTGKAIRAQAGDVLTFLIESTHGDDKATKIWVDINGDGVFNEAEELLINENLGNSEGTMTVPADMTAGSYRLRIRKGWDHQNACRYDRWTQVEDYVLQVVGQTTAFSTTVSPAATTTNQPDESGVMSLRLFSDELSGLWDIYFIHLFSSESCDDGSKIDTSGLNYFSSGHYDADYYSHDRAFDDSNWGLWGGRSDANGDFYIGLDFAVPTVVRCVKMDQQGHIADKVSVQIRDTAQADWETVVVRSDLVYGENTIAISS